MSRGIAIELLFDSQAVMLGLIVSKPLFDVPYDRVVDTGVGFKRVQIKHTTNKRCNRPNSYKVNIYTKVDGEKMNLKGHTDILAVYINDSWYFIPASALPESKGMSIALGGKWEKYKDNWDIFYEKE